MGFVDRGGVGRGLVGLGWVFCLGDSVGLGKIT